MIHNLILAWCLLCGILGALIALLSLYIIGQERGRRWMRAYKWRRGSLRRAEMEMGIDTVSRAIMHLDNRFLSRGIWREMHYLPAEDEHAREIILDAWRSLLEEATQ